MRASHSATGGKSPVSSPQDCWYQYGCCWQGEFMPEGALIPMFSDCQSRVPVAQPRHLFCVPAFRYRMGLYVGSYALLCSAAVSFRGARMLFLISETLFSPLLSEFDFQKDCALKVIKYWAESHPNLSPPRSS